MTTKKRIPILLIGGGHSHLQMLYHARHDREFLDSITLVSNHERTFYSGMMASWLEDIYQKADVSIDLKTLSEHYKIPFILGEALEFSPKASTVTLADGQILSYQQVSFDIGSCSATDASLNFNSSAYTLKPFEQILGIKKMLRSKSNGYYGVVGGGVASLEMACAMAALTKDSDVKIDIMTQDKGLLPHASKRLKAHVFKRLKGYDFLDVKKIKTVTSTEEQFFDAVVWAIGSKAPELFKKSIISTDEQGYLLLEATLQNRDYKNVWAAGDCMAIKTLNLKKTGVNAIKEAPILYYNLKQTQSKRPNQLKSYKPKKNQLAIYSTGNKEGILHYGNYIWSGKLPWLIKDWIDRQYMKKHQKGPHKK